MRLQLKWRFTQNLLLPSVILNLMGKDIWVIFFQNFVYLNSRINRHLFHAWVILWLPYYHNKIHHLGSDRLCFIGVYFCYFSICIHFPNLLFMRYVGYISPCQPILNNLNIGFNSYKLINNCRWLLFPILRRSSWHIHSRLSPPPSLNQF